MAGLAKFFFETWLGKWVAGALGLLGLVSVFAYQQQSKGARHAVEKINKVNDRAAGIGASAARKSAAGSVRGPVDPTTRND